MNDDEIKKWLEKQLMEMSLEQIWEDMIFEEQYGSDFIKLCMPDEKLPPPKRYGFSGFEI